MKVLMIPSWYPTPCEPLLGTFYKEQAEALVARGIEVAVAHVSVSNDFNPKHNGIRREVINGVLTYIYTRPNLTPRWERGRCWQRTRMLEALYRRIEKEWGQPDVVNLRSSLHGYEAISLCKKHNLPLFFMEHSSYVMTEAANSPALIRLRTVMKAATVNACVSNALRKVMQPWGKARVIPDPLDSDAFYPKEKRPHNTFQFRAMGQLRSIKGYDMLIRAFARLLKLTNKPVCLEIAGEGDLRRSLQQLIEEYGINDQCKLVGRVPRDQAIDFMNGCDCFVCSSRVETLSCVLNEAAACGKPVISTQCGGPLDIVTEESGLLIPVDNEDAMAQAMLAMIDTASQYDAKSIRENTIKRFGRDTVCEKLIQACRDTMAKPDLPLGTTKRRQDKKPERQTWMTILFETLKISSVTFGGGYAMISLISDFYTKKHNYLTKEEIMDTMAVAQSIPGPFGLNTATMAGYRTAGLRGGIAASLGMALPPLAIMSIVAICYTWFLNNEYIAAAMYGIRACVCGLMAWVAITMGRTAIKTGRGIWTAVVFAVALLISLFTKLHAVFLIAGGLLVGLIFHAIFAVIDYPKGQA